MTENKNQINNLTLQEQKDLMDHALNSNRKSAIKTFMIVLPITFITIVVLIGSILYFAGVWSF